MGLTGLFKENEYKKQIEELQQQLSSANQILETFGNENIKTYQDLQDRIKKSEQILSADESKIAQQESRIKNLSADIMEKEKQVVVLDDEILVQSFGLYKPRFLFATSSDYKDRLAALRNKEKELIKNGVAVTGNKNITYNQSLKEGQKAVKDAQKLLLRAFNTECDELIEKVKYSNYEASKKKMNAAASQISKLGKYMGVSVTHGYLNCKLLELRMSFEFQQKKQEEKERLRELRAQERETARLEREIAEQRRKFEKEKQHYEHALTDIMRQLLADPDNNDLLAKKSSILSELGDVEKSLTDIDYREANIRAGYIYIISNIGAFGENIYKIGMTRRLDPYERVRELGDASVPFNFDVHAMIFSEDAPALEAALHRAFEKKKVNMVNTRREFFNVTLDEIKDVIRKNFDKTVEFTDVADADQYRITLRLKEQMG